jgi:hypothetical protein
VLKLAAAINVSAACRDASISQSLFTGGGSASSGTDPTACTRGGGAPRPGRNRNSRRPSSGECWREPIDGAPWGAQRLAASAQRLLRPRIAASMPRCAVLQPYRPHHGYRAQGRTPASIILNAVGTAG